MNKLANRIDLKDLAEKKSKENKRYKKIVTLCAGTGCTASGCASVLTALNKELKNKKLVQEIKVRTTGCHGFCEQGPLMVIEPENIFYCRLKLEDVSEIISKTLVKDEIIERLLYQDRGTKITYERARDEEGRFIADDPDTPENEAYVVSE